MANTYYDVLNAVKNYYGSGSDEWVAIAKYGITADNAESILRQVPGVEIIKSKSGKLQGYNYISTLSTETTNIGEIINSNSQNGSFSPSNTITTRINSTSTIGADGKLQMSSGSKLLSRDIPINTTFQKLSVGAAAVMAGARLGAFIDSAIYNANPNYWDDVMPSINPETWGDIAGDNELGRSALNFLFGIDGDNTTAYMNERAFAYMAYAMNQEGFFSSTQQIKPFESIAVGDKVYKSNLLYGSLRELFPIIYKGENISFMTDDVIDDYNNDVKGIVGYEWDTGQEIVGKLHVFESNIDDIKEEYNVTAYYGSENYGALNSNIGLLQRSYFLGRSSRGLLFIGVGYSSTSSTPEFTIKYPDAVFRSQKILVIDSIIDAYKEGVTKQPNIFFPVTDGWNDIDSVLDSLKQQYPNWWDNAIYNDVPQPDGSLDRQIYIPMPTTYTNSPTDTMPTNTTITQNETSVGPDTSPESLLETILRYITGSPTPVDTNNPPDTGSGNTPIVISPNGNASSLWAIYNPSQNELDSFGSWLWNSNFIEQLKKLFNDPMQAILGVHKVFASPNISGKTTIKCGYIDSGISSNVVASQYVTVNCGTISLREYFGNVFDYSPYTDVRLFLPFIGIVHLDVADIMRSSINVTYHVDVITGACLAEVSVIRDGVGGIIYTYGGSCIVSYPISSGSYMGIVSGALSVVGSAIGVGASIISGNPLGAAVGSIGVAQSTYNMRSNVQHSGGFTGASACMGGKIPYLIISRPQTSIANNVNHYLGYPSNYTTTLSAITGYARVLSCHVENISTANTEEKAEIENALKSGVLIL